MALERSDVEKIAHLASLGLNEADLPQTTAALGDWSTQQRAIFTVGATHVGGLGLAQGQLFGEADEAVDLWIVLGDARKQVA